VELCLIIGFFRLIFRPGTLGKFKAEYISLTIVSILILLGVFVLPTVGWGMGSVRIFGITLLLMAPLFLFGGEAIAYGIMKLASVFRRGLASSRLSLDSPVVVQFLVLAIMIPYFIFNSGVVFELSRSQTTQFINMPYSIALSSYRVDITDRYTRQDIAAVDWLSTVAEADYIIYTDHHGARLPGNTIELHDRAQQLLPMKGAKQISSPSYIYLRTWNTAKKMLTFGTGYATRQSISFDDLPWFMQAIEKSGRIYNNGSAQLLSYR
jgi:uncharacterized membrane protein